ncbi:MAG: hypothetical protein P9F75_07315 [Candidatus Contendobacter sp.]|nr:hypothetical protein [Candidatus Contendobacter sp.]
MELWEQVYNKGQAMLARAQAQAAREGVEFQSDRGREIGREYLRAMLESMTPEERFEHRQQSEWGPGAFTLLQTPDQGEPS